MAPSRFSVTASLSLLSGLVSSTCIPRTTPSSSVNSTTCGSSTFIYEALAGYGFIPNNAIDKVGDTIGGIGSSIAIDKNSWSFDGSCYKGYLYGLPDRGWNTEGTLNYQNRVHKFQINLTPNDSATISNPSGPNIQISYLDTIFLTDPAGEPVTGLDADFQGPYKTFPELSVDVPSAHYDGDGFGGAGNGGYRVVADTEGLVLAHDGSYWISDEYGPYIYHFDTNGKMIDAIRPNDAIVPFRNTTESFSANSPPRYDPSRVPNPADPTSGRANNQGLEGLTTNPEGTRLYALLQSATDQDGGLKNKNSNHPRFLVYDISTSPPAYLAEYVVELQHVVPSDSSTKVARQSEIHYISDTQFLVLARDSGAGHGQSTTQSIFRHADIFDITNATNVKSSNNDAFNASIASPSSGKLNAGVKPATYCTWLDYNVNAQLNRFGVHNGGASDQFLLNEKWESLALVPVNSPGSAGKDAQDEYFLISFSDNDFITQDGNLKNGEFHYADSSGYNLDTQVLAFKVQLPAGSKPLVG